MQDSRSWLSKGNLSLKNKTAYMNNKTICMLSILSIKAHTRWTRFGNATRLLDLTDRYEYLLKYYFIDVVINFDVIKNCVALPKRIRYVWALKQYIPLWWSGGKPSLLFHSPHVFFFVFCTVPSLIENIVGIACSWSLVLDMLRKHEGVKCAAHSLQLLYK